MQTRKWISNTLCGVLAAGIVSISFAQTSFFEGKNIVAITTGSPGGKGDYATRVLARYLPKYIPGTPNIIVQNMPGGGGVIQQHCSTAGVFHRLDESAYFFPGIEDDRPMYSI